MDIIFLRDLRVEAIIGIYEWERRATQQISIDLEMAADIATPAATDSIGAALNYKDVAKRLIDFVSNSEFQLVETLVESIARIVVTEFAVPWVRVSIAKPGAIEGSREVGVIIERTASHYG
jgi:dihydroneopterin aldolase